MGNISIYLISYPHIWWASEKTIAYSFAKQVMQSAIKGTNRFTGAQCGNGYNKYLEAFLKHSSWLLNMMLTHAAVILCLYTLRTWISFCQHVALHRTRSIYNEVTRGGKRLLLKLRRICLHQSLCPTSGLSGRIVEFPAIVGRAEQRHKRATCEEFVTVFHNLTGVSSDLRLCSTAHHWMIPFFQFCQMFWDH